jgi:hypothetical protein
MPSSGYRRVRRYKLKSEEKPPPNPRTLNQQNIQHPRRTGSSRARGNRYGPCHLRARRARESDCAEDPREIRSHPQLSASEKRLWSEDRDENERVRLDDWHPLPDSGWLEVDSVDTVGRRRRAWRAEYPGRDPYPGRED